MREIKFRALCKEDNILGIVKEINFDWGVQLYDRQGYLYALKDVILMQYTGLNDCKRTKEYPNGEEIYENDICIDSQGDVIQIVWSKLYQWGCKIIKTEDVLSHGLIFPLWQWDNCEKNGYRTLEKIGNIYDNPEMVEGC